MIVNHHLASINKKGLLNLLFIFSTFFLVTAVQAQDSEPPEKIQALELPSLSGEVFYHFLAGRLSICLLQNIQI